MPIHRPNAPRPPVSPLGAGSVLPLNEREIDELQELLDSIPAPLEPLDVTLLDGFLCGLLVQPQRVPDSHWLPHVSDSEGRPLPASFKSTPRLHALVLRRYDELNQAIGQRQWFDPWVFELDLSDSEAEPHDDEWDDGPPPEVSAVYPWVAGFATALDLFPALMAGDDAALMEPLALIYRHFDADDLEDADDLLAEIETLEPPADLTEAVEGLVRATLLLADVGRPLAKPARPQRPGAGRPRSPSGGGRNPGRR